MPVPRVTLSRGRRGRNVIVGVYKLWTALPGYFCILYFLIFFHIYDTQPRLATATRIWKSVEGKRGWEKGAPCDPVARGKPIGGGGRWTNSPPLSLSLSLSLFLSLSLSLPRALSLLIGGRTWSCKSQVTYTTGPGQTTRSIIVVSHPR